MYTTESLLELERYACELFNKEAALYFPTGTMGNFCSILAHCWTRGTEVILGDQSHVHLLEQGNISQFGGIHIRTVKNHSDGTFNLDELKSKIRSHSDYMMSSLYPSTSLISIENTHNVMNGSVLPLSFIRQVKQIALENNIKLHMDGARVLNAAVYLGVSPADVVNDVDSVSVCLSKGLCSPIGAIVLGDLDFIRRCYRVRKGIGGGMRQAGYMAACGLVALKTMIGRLADDHRRALDIATSVNSLKSKYFTVDLDLVKTNIVYINCKNIESSELTKRLKIITDDERTSLNNDVCILKMLGFGTDRVRFLTSAVINDDLMRLAILKLIYVIKEFDNDLNTTY